ncbi:hypothetical protein B0F90DRAFT_1721867 [Multifurca ochricompacta]|uniref:Uncharacterized protein n=1 Tax=Multifurca ochricompacta TaxID=376703 RepID=A0AAD4M448_9AGAM|nr:hypothetical protein B0F90DRAFT_1721867 [Multifurca ochricompacta]
MPLQRLESTTGLPLSRPLDEEDVMMTGVNKSAVATTSSLPTIITPSPSINRPTSLGKRRHDDTPDPVPHPTTRVQSATSSTPPTPISSSSTSSAILSTASKPTSRRAIFTLSPIDTTPSTTSESSSSMTPELNSPAPTEIALDLEYVEPTPEEHIKSLQAEGIKVRDFAYEPVPSSSKAPEVFDPLPSLIATDWHMRNPEKNHGALSGKSLFRLIKVGWLSMSEVAKRVHGREFTALAQYSERPDEERYPFIVAPNEPLPTPSERVRMRRNAGFRTHLDDVPDREFFGYDPTGHSDLDEEDSSTPQTKAEGPNTKRRKLKGKAKPLCRSKPLRRDFSRPEA